MNQIMSNDKPIKQSKVIQFADSSYIRRIEKGYYVDIDPKEWNPQGDIILHPIEKVPELKKDGIEFTPEPSEKYTTFVEVMPNKYAFIAREQYAPTFMAEKQKVIAVVLQKLGIHEYYIYSEFQANVKTGKNDNLKGSVEGEISTPEVSGSTSVDGTHTQNSGINAEAYYVQKEYKRLEGRKPSMKEWREARELALDANVYSEISDIIEMRKPGSNNLIIDSKKLKIGISIDARISLASSLKALTGVGALGKIGGSFLNSFDFEAGLKGHYETFLFYNFNPNFNSPEYQNFVKEQLQKKDS